MPEAYKLNAFIEQGGGRQPFLLRISEPVSSSGGEDYYCRVHAPLIFRKEMKIHGVDGQQARDLAIWTVKSLLGKTKLVDSEGSTVEF